jgi:hypothetical protein
MTYSVKRKFRSWQKEHPNFITPYVLAVHQKGDYIIEVSEGTDMDHKAMYGVSVLKKDGDKFISQHKYSEKSKPFSDRKEAYAYANKLKDEVK